jgi:hypothetical protein
MRKLGENRFDKWRVEHPMGPIPADLRDYAGAFIVDIKNPLSFGSRVKVIASRGGDVWGRSEAGAHWDHVSVSAQGRCPTWEEMCFVKDAFFYPDEVAMQLHPVREYINNHPFCLHLWRPSNEEIPLPPSILVGVKELNIT